MTGHLNNLTIEMEMNKPMQLFATDKMYGLIEQTRFATRQRLASITRFFCLLLLLPASLAHADNMTAIPRGSGFCTEDRMAEEDYCHEWALASAPSIRFVAEGYSDGIEYGFYKLQGNGHYEHIIRVYPVIRDSSRSGALFWGYAWDIHDIVLPGKDGRKEVEVLATFEHTIDEDYFQEVESPEWQKRIPAVLFIGRTTQPEIAQLPRPPRKFKPSTLNGLCSSAKRQ